MRIGVLSRSSGYWSTAQILRAIRAAGHEPVYLKTQEVRLVLEEGFGATCQGVDLGDLDVIMPRIGRSLTDLGFAVLRHLETMETPTTLTSQALMTARNKFLALQALQKAGVRIPRTILVASRMDAEEALRLLPSPAVLKLLTGTQGIGVLRVKEPAEAASIIDTLHSLGEMIAIQEYIPHPGVDIRALVVGGKVVGSMKRVAKLHEWRTNIHLGAKPLPHKLDQVAEETSLKAAQATGLEIAGVDLVYRENEPYVLEVNACPGFRGLVEASGVDVAASMVGYAVRKARGKG